MNLGQIAKRLRIAKRQRREQLRLAWRLAKVMRVKPRHVVIVVSLALLVAGLDAVGLGLLLPLAEGVTAGDFAAVTLPTVLEKVVGTSLQALSVSRTPAVMFFVLASVIFLVNFLALVTGLVSTIYGQYLQGHYQWQLHTFVYNRYFSFGKFFFDTTSQGSIKKILEYTERIVKLVRVAQNNLATFARLLAHLVVMIWLSWQLMLVVLLVFPVLYIVSRQIMKSVNTLWKQAKDIALELGRESFNMLSALPLVWSYSGEKEAKQKYADMNEKYRRVQLKAQALGDFSIAVPRLLTLLTMLIVVLFITGWINRGQELDLARLIIFLYVASRTVPLFKVFNTVWVVISEMAPPILEVMRLFKDKDKHIVKEGKRVFEGLTSQIEVKNLTFAYQGREPIFQGVSFTVPQGKLTALVGPSGSGKSTIISLLMRFYDCPERSILLDGEDIRDYTLDSLRSHMALVDQEPILLNDTLRNNLTYGHEHVASTALSQIIQKTQLKELVDRLPKGLETTVGDRGVQLSGGEKQRVAIARAMLKGSEIVLLDEATSALDSITEQYIQEALAEVIRDRTALVVAHRLSTIKSAQQIIYLDRGKVLERGTLDQLLQREGEFAKQWRAQMFN